MNWFLMARHWQIFLLTFLVPGVIILSGFILVSQLFNTGVLFYAIPVGWVLSQSTFYVWMWTVGSKLTPKNTPKSEMRLFRLFVFIPMVLIGFALVFWLGGALWFSLGSFSVVSVLYGSLLVIFPLQIAMVVTMFYCFMFVARAVKTAETGRSVSFEGYFREFVMVALLPLGIWFLQPRINKLYKGLRPD